MIEVVVASGKGGTGKTFISSNLAYYLQAERGGVVAVDADVEAPDLVLALGGPLEEVTLEEVTASRKALIDYDKCIKCWECARVCRFHAVERQGDLPVIVREYCEGCGACLIACPADAIEFTTSRTGVIKRARSAHGPLAVWAELEVGERGSGLLVYKVRGFGRDLALREGVGYVVVDSAPGIGCPVISSMAGANLVVVVVEPTAPSIQGARRLISVAKALKVRPLLVVNKYDLNPELSAKIPELLGVDALGYIPYDNLVVESYTSSTPLLRYKPEAAVTAKLRSVLKAVVEEAESV